MTDTPLGFVHRYVPATGDDPFTLLTLHGTGGTENDLLGLGSELRPGAAVLSPRGNVLERGMPRFFRRIAEGVFDLDDLARRTDELAAFISAAASQYRFDAGRVVAIGFSNGANIAASVLFTHPKALHAALLLSPMLPYEPETRPQLAGKAVFVGAGKADTMVPAEQARSLVDVLRDGGAEVTEHWHAGGHTITHDELAAAKRWIRALG